MWPTAISKLFSFAWIFSKAQPVEEAHLSIIVRLAIVLFAIAVATAAWGLIQLSLQLIERWREKFLSEAEMEMEEMLMQLPAAKLFNYSLLMGGLLAVIVFLFVLPGSEGYNWTVAIILASIVLILSVLSVKIGIIFLKKHRLEKFNLQLEDALMSMGNALKAGFSISQAIEMVIKQKKYPISLEFQLMMQQTQLGVTFDTALMNMAKRVESEDFFLVATAIITARQTGGDLTGVFERLAGVIRERLRIQRRIRTLTAQGRLQGIVLAALPIVLLAILYFFVNPELVKSFFTSPIGIAALIVVVILEVAGFMTIRKIVNIDI